MSKIVFADVSKIFVLKGSLFRKQKLHAVSGVSMKIEEGHTLAVVGESGCGKTTLARLLMGLHRPDGGSILVDGENVGALKGKEALRHFRSNVQMIFQDPFASLNPAHDVGSILTRAVTLHHPELKSIQVRQQVADLLTLVGLTPPADFMRKHPAQLSGGQRQRIGIARALAVKPSVIVADEPTSMLDVSIGIDIMNLLIDLKQKQKLTMMYITHNLASARYMADEMAVFYAGTCVEYGDIDEVVNVPYHPYTVLLLNSTPEPFRSEAAEIEASEEGADLISGKPQCMFCRRCPAAVDRCFSDFPPDYTYGTRRVRCFLYEGREEDQGPAVEVDIYRRKSYV